jgi:fungal STAND N-terminal Goodbye domain
MSVLLFPRTIDTIALSSSNTLLTLSLMSYTYPTAASSSSNFQLIINDALDTYKARTRKDLRDHPLATQLQACDSPTAILAILQQQVQGLDQSRSADERWTKWLDPTVNVLNAFSDILGVGVSLVCFSSCTCPKSALMFVAVILTCERHFRRSRGPPFSVYP